MKIGLVGYYGWGNYGDELFLQIFTNLFSSAEVVLFHDALEGKLRDNVEELIDSVDCIVIGGGDLLIPWYRSWLYWDMRYLKKPVYVYGVGVPTWSESREDVVSYYREFLNHENIKFMGFRDKESALWVEENLKIEANKLCVYPDVVLSKRVNSLRESSDTVALILRYQPTYAVENIKNLIRLMRQLHLKCKIILLGVGITLKDDRSLLQHYFFDSDVDIVVRSNIDDLTEEIAECRFVISQKFHGIVMAYLLKIPFIALATADKFVSFCNLVGAERFISWDSDLLLQEKFLELTTKDFKFDKHQMMVDGSIKGLEQLKNKIFQLEE